MAKHYIIPVKTTTPGKMKFLIMMTSFPVAINGATKFNSY